MCSTKNLDLTPVIPPVRATELNPGPSLDHGAAPFTSDGPIQNTQPNSQREPNYGRDDTYPTNKPASAPTLSTDGVQNQEEKRSN